MSLMKRNGIYWLHIGHEGRRIRESTKTTDKKLAQRIHDERVRQLRDSLTGVDSREERKRTIEEIATEYRRRKEQRQKQELPNGKKASQCERYQLLPIIALLGKRTLGEITAAVVSDYITERRRTHSPKTVNGETQTLYRILGEHGDRLKAQARRDFGKLYLNVPKTVGKRFSADERLAINEAIEGVERSPRFQFAMTVEKHTGMRGGETIRLQWNRIFLDADVPYLFINDAKSAAGVRPLAMNDELLAAFRAWREESKRQFGEIKPNWYIFPAGRVGTKLDPARHVSSFKTAWKIIREASGVVGRMHDLRHSMNTDMGKIGTPGADRRAIMGHASDAMTIHYDHGGELEAQRDILNEVAKLRKREEHAAQKRSKLVAIDAA